MENRCVICGVVIPEGRQVCPNCEKQAIKQAAELARNKMFVGVLGTNGEFRRYTKHKEQENEESK